jgi:hypothetical protein
MDFPIELFLIFSGIILLVFVIARRRMLQHRFFRNREKLATLEFENTLPEEIVEMSSRVPRIKGNGKFEFKAEQTLLHFENFERVRLAKRLYIAEISEIEVLLIPDPANIERRLGVLVSIEGFILGYVPEEISIQIHKYLLAHSAGVRANAKIYLGSRPEFNAVYLDFEEPLRLEFLSKRK